MALPYIPAGVASRLTRARRGPIARSAKCRSPGLYPIGHQPLSLIGQFSAGAALRIRAMDLRRLFDETISLRSLLMRYTQVLFTQASQSAVCNGRHTIEQALCRWLLAKQDRAPCDEIQVTHEWVASLMGVRREGVSIAAERLHTAGVIRCGRGKITIVDRNSLEARSCECYRIVRDEYARLLK